jgi:hypothetical protein
MTTIASELNEQNFFSIITAIDKLKELQYALHIQEKEAPDKFEVGEVIKLHGGKPESGMDRVHKLMHGGPFGSWR